jgi:hypothetical protein
LLGGKGNEGEVMVDVPCSNKGDRGRQIDCCSVAKAKAKSIAKKKQSTCDKDEFEVGKKERG